MNPAPPLLPNGFSPTAWEGAKTEARQVMIEVVRGYQGVISYSSLVAHIPSIQFECDDPRLARMLDEISTEEFANGRGMLSVVAVHQSSDRRPGMGFYALAARLGKDISDTERFWSEEFTTVQNYWRQH